MAGVAPGRFEEVPVPGPPAVEEVVVWGVRSRESRCATSVMVSSELGFRPGGIASVLLLRGFVEAIFVVVLSCSGCDSLLGR